MIVKDLRKALFDKLIRFRMAYFDTSAVGRLVTRSVNDIETIASIFSQGLFMIIADFLKWDWWSLSCYLQIGSFH